MSLAKTLFSLLVGATLIAPTLARAQDAGELAEIERQLKDRAAEEKRLRKEADEHAREVTALRHRLIETADSIQNAEREITRLEGSITQLATEKNEAEQALRREGENLSDVLAALQSLELSRPPALLLSPEDANKAARTAMLLATAAPEVDARAAELREAINLLASLTADLTAEQTLHRETSVELSARRVVLSELMAEKEKARDVATRLAAAAQRETAALAARATSLRDVIQRLERLAHSVTPRIKPPAPKRAEPQQQLASPQTPSIRREKPKPFKTAKRFADAKGALRPPVAGQLVGRFNAPRPEGGRFEGLRFNVRDQAIVTAPFESRVAFARDWQPIGNLIVLDVGGGYHVLLMGVGAILVNEGQRVTAGEPVAEMAEGRASLDLEIRRNGEPVNPSLWLSSKSVEEMAY